MALRLIFMYLFCVIPVSIWNIVFANDQETEDNKAFSGILVYCLYWIQYGINWIFYFFNNPRYRRAFKQLISCILRKDLKPIRHYPRQIRRRTNLSNRIFIVSDKVPSINVIHGIESSSHSQKLEWRTVKFDMCNNHHPTGTMFYKCESSSPSMDSSLSDYTETTSCTDTDSYIETDSYTETTSCTSESRWHFSMMFGYSEENISKSMDFDNTECCYSQYISTAGNYRRRHSSSICGPANINFCKVLSRKCSL